ncbi:7923_t:CDS:2, partial [Gigaspora margarita]
NKTVELILEMTKKVLEQNTLIMERQELLERQRQEKMKAIGSRCILFLKKEAMQGIKVAIDNWLYPNNKAYEQAIRKELEAFYLDRMQRYKKDSKWEALFNKIENLHVFKNKVSPMVNLESSETEITSWET